MHEHHLLNLAIYFSTTEHVTKRGQTYGFKPYTHHLEAVDNEGLAYGIREIPYRCAFWLHDVVEDCPGVKIKHIAEHFGQEAANLVDAVTDEPGPNRKARKLATYEKTRSIRGGIVVKLADRLSNVKQGGALLDMYVKEYESFRRALHGGAVEPHHEQAVALMWDKLDQLMGWRPT